MNKDFLNFQNELAGFIACDSALVKLPYEITPGGTIYSAVNALEVHKRGYFARLSEVLEGIYEVTAKILGDDFFDVTSDFIAQNPSHFFDINEYGREFHKFLNENNIRPVFLSELARFERVFDDLFYIQQSPEIDDQKLKTLFKNPNQKLILGQHVRLFESKFPIFDIWKSGSQSEPISYPERREGSTEKLVLYKKGDHVFVKSLTDLENLFYKNILKGETLSELFEINHPEMDEQFVQHFFESLRLLQILNDIE